MVKMVYDMCILSQLNKSGPAFCVPLSFSFGFTWWKGKRASSALKGRRTPRRGCQSQKLSITRPPPTWLVIGSPRARRGLRDRKFGNVPPAWLHTHLI